MLAVLRAVPGARWTRVADALGDLDAVRVREAVAHLERDGMIEVDPGGRARLALR